MTAVGIHDHPHLKLGRRPPKNAPALLLSSFFNPAAVDVPQHPLTDDEMGDKPFILGGNDRYGTCGPTSAANDLVAVTDGKVVVTDQDVFDLYRRSGNPNFDPSTGADDNGVVLQDMLNALLAGGIGGHKPLAFARIEVTDQAELEAAVYAFKGCLWGVNLQTAQQAQTDAQPPVWDYRRSGQWGGHAVYSGEYIDATGRIAVESWQVHVDTTEAFRDHQLEEAWVVIWPELADAPGVDREALKAAYKDLTGKDLVLPDPVDPPAPAPSVDPKLIARLRKDEARDQGAHLSAAEVTEVLAVLDPPVGKVGRSSWTHRTGHR